MTADGFGTEQARRRVLAAWTDSAQRFREDANSEEDLVLGGYRDRVIIELAQNAADAALAGGVPGRLLLRLDDAQGAHGVLIAANTGSPLDQDGVLALSSLRASAKRDGDTVGRFGVGFAAVLAVSDEPAVLSRSGGVRFSARQTRDLVGDLAAQAPELITELGRRDGHVPILRLPFATTDAPPDGYDTAAVLPLRDAAARDLVHRLLAEVGDPLLLALPGLSEIVIQEPGAPPRRLADAEQRWHVLRREGLLSPALAASRPVEERASTRWQVTWAVPRPGNPGRPGDPGAAAQLGERVFHAPTPSDEPMTLPALLIATLPLDPSRRHIAPGPVTDDVIAHAAQAYADLVIEQAQDAAENPAQLQAWRLVPVGLPGGALDGALRAQVLSLLPGVPMLPAADEPELQLRPRDALALAPPVGSDEQAVPELATWIAGLVLAPRAADAAFTALGVRRLALAELIEDLPQAADAHRWRRLYDVLEPYAADPREREALASIGVPLAGGQVARGARGLLLGTDGVPAQALARLGVKVIDPEAAHPLLERLGATTAGPRPVLELPAVQSAVLAGTDWEDDGDAGGYAGGGTTEAVLELVAAAVQAGQLAPGDLPWLGELEIEDEDGELAPAGALALPGSAAAGWFDPDDIGLASADLTGRWGPEVLAAIGVLSGPGLWHGHDLGLDDPPGDGDDPADPASVLEGWEQWCEYALDEIRARSGDVLGALVPELVAVRDLDAVRPAALPEVVTAIAADPLLRTALVTPVRVLAGPVTADVTGYTAWWLRRELTSGAAAGPDAEPGLAALLPPAPDWVRQLDAGAQRALGVVTGLDDLDAAALPHLIDRLADPAVEVPPGLLLRLLSRMAVLSRDGVSLPEAPESVRAWSASGTEVVAANEACVIDAPMYRQRADLGWALPVPGDLAPALADLLELPLASDLAEGSVTEQGPAAGVLQTLDPGVRELAGGGLAGSELAGSGLAGSGPGQWCEHEELRVDGVEVDWWVDDDGLVHAATLDGLARALASAAGHWHLRETLSAVLLADVADRPRLLAEALADETFTD